MCNVILVQRAMQKNHPNACKAKRALTTRVSCPAPLQTAFCSRSRLSLALLPIYARRRRRRQRNNTHGLWGAWRRGPIWCTDHLGHCGRAMDLPPWRMAHQGHSVESKIRSTVSALSWPWCWRPNHQIQLKLTPSPNSDAETGSTEHDSHVAGCSCRVHGMDDSLP